jgi:hypothetical protein
MAPLDSDADASWAFLLHCGVLDRTEEAAFRATLAAELARGEITGPQLSLRVASGVTGTDRGKTRDPDFDEARELWRKWQAGRRGR